jgi:DNA-binding PadR family transcriptional regulator
MHGYEVGKAIAQLFGGVYEPSPGVVYPNLQWLEDEGMLKAVQQRGKKVYRVTDRGRKFAEERREELVRLLEIGRDTSRGSKWALMREGRQLSRLLELGFPDLTETKAKRVVAILQDAREKVEEAMQQ